MPSPTVDIIVPVWNNPFETRACLAAILVHSPEARLIIIDNGSSRETQLMLEEFSEQLEERGLFITSERNIGLVPAINRGLAVSDADFTVIVRPNVTVSADWLATLLDAAGEPGTGIVSPLFRGSGAPPLARPLPGCPLVETFSLSFATLLIRGELRRLLGGFDEKLDGAEWCLRDYIRRAEARSYRVCVTARPELACSRETVFGSPERRQEQVRTSRDNYLARWGVAHHYCLYFGAATDAADLPETVAAIAAAARRGHRFTLLLHRRQFKEFRRRGWHALHTAVEISSLPLLGVQRSLGRRLAALKAEFPDLIPVRGGEDVDFPGAATALCLSDVTAVHRSGDCSPAQLNTALEVV
jgi:glycosyltransferase involved in cell wall biosynthesis